MSEILRLIWVRKVRQSGLGKFHKPIKDKKLGGHLGGRIVKRVPDSMKELGEFFDTDHFPKNKSGLIELVVRNIVFSRDQLSLYSL